METNVMEKESEPKASQSQTASPALAAAAPEPKKPGTVVEARIPLFCFRRRDRADRGIAYFLLVFRWRVNTDDAEVDGHLNPVSAKISGNVLEVLVDDNQQVKAGQVLVKIDPRDYQARVDQMRAALGACAGAIQRGERDRSEDAGNDARPKIQTQMPALARRDRGAGQRESDLSNGAYVGSGVCKFASREVSSQFR